MIKRKSFLPVFFALAASFVSCSFEAEKSLTELNYVENEADGSSRAVNNEPAYNISEGTYFFIAKCSNKSLDNSGWSLERGANVAQWKYGGDQGNQDWVLRNAGNGYYYIINKYSGYALDGNAKGTTDGTNIIQWDLGDRQANQMWKFVIQSDSSFKIINKHSGLVMDVDSASKDDGANVHLWTWNGTDAQKWFITKISDSITTGTGRKIFGSGAEKTITDMSSWALDSYSLSSYNGKTVKLQFSADMAVENNTGSSINLMWQVNVGGYPAVISKEFPAGKTNWTNVSGTKDNLSLGTNNVLYLSNYSLSGKDIKIYIKNTKLNVTATGAVSNTPEHWSRVPSLKEAYVDSGLYDHFGIASTMAELKGRKEGDWDHRDVPEILKRHGNTTTLGNEAKPQWILWNYGTKVPTAGTFTASNGKTISVPALPSLSESDFGLGGLGSALQVCKDKGIQMRGHVLTWHSQTFDWFFCNDYDVSKGLTDKATMTARHEWYIKTVLEYVKNWEDKYNGGKRIIYTWDVVNEAVADDANDTNWVRGSTPGTSSNIPKLQAGCHSENGTSRWYQIYKSDEFIVNAFRFANKYAPKDVTLCYNDYNEYMEYGGGKKRSGIIKLIKSVKSHEKDSKLPTRINAFGMQSHYSDWISLSSIEDSMKQYLALGIDLQVTELDFAWNSSKYRDARSKGYSGTNLEDLYKDTMNLYKKYAKSRRRSNGITSITLWCTEDRGNWLNSAGNTYYPAMFNRNSKNEIVAKPAFYAVLKAAQ